jgi:hypothetical protein
MTDAPSVSRLQRLVGSVGDLARPFAIYAVAAGTAYCMATRDAVAIGASGAVLSSLYFAKAYENSVQSKATADVAKAQATNP